MQRSTSIAFNRAVYPGMPMPYVGIYRCEGCGREAIVAQAGEALPEDHHRHAPDGAEVVWRLMVYPDSRPSSERD